MESIVSYLAAGVATGVVSGLFGVGGGLTVVPALVLALPYEDVPTRHIMHMAIGTSLAVMVFTAAVTTVWRHRRGDLDWPLLWRLAALVALGGAIGATIGDALPGSALRWMFVGFVALTIAREVWRHWLRPAKTSAPGRSASATTTAKRLSFTLHGVAAGVVGALLGVGAAVIVTPFLTRRGYSIQGASGLSATLSAIIGLAAGLGYILGGLNEVGLPQASLGYLYLPAFLGVAIGALAGSPLGVGLSHRLPDSAQRTLFILYLCVVLAVMVARQQT